MTLTEFALLAIGVILFSIAYRLEKLHQLLVHWKLEQDERQATFEADDDAS